MLQKLKEFKWGYIILTILIAAAGVCFIAFRETLSTIALIMGILLTLVGVVFGILTIADKRRGVGFALKIVFAVIALSCGIVTIIVHQGEAVEWLVALFGLLLVVDGSFKLQTSAMSKRYDSVAWWLVLIPAVLVIIGGFFSIRFQISGGSEEELLKQQSAYSVVIGVTMIIDAIANLLSPFFISYYEKKMKSEGASDSAETDGQALTADATETAQESEAESECAEGPEPQAEDEAIAEPQAEETTAEAPKEPEAQAEEAPIDTEAAPDAKKAKKKLFAKSKKNKK